MFLETVKIKHGSGWLNINERDFDPELHTLWTEIPTTSEPSLPEQPTTDRQAELQDMTWRQLKTICEDLGIEKPNDAEWADMIGAILEAEG